MVRHSSLVVLVLLTVFALGACRRQPSVTPPVPEPFPTPAASTPREAPPTPQPVETPLPVPLAPLAEDEIDGRSLDDLNRDSPLQPAFFVVDSAELDAAGRAVVASNADVLKRYSSWEITIEGHCDERGTAEYNLALGERRAMAVKTYLVSLGIRPDRIRTVSYGKEFPFDPASHEAAWAKNRRAHFVITAR